MQRRSQLEEQKAELSSSNSSFEREIKEAEKQLSPIQNKMKDLEKQQTAIKNEKDRHAEEIRSTLEAIMHSGNRVRELNAEIKRYF